MVVFLAINPLSIAEIWYVGKKKQYQSYEKNYMFKFNKYRGT